MTLIRGNTVWSETINKRIPVIELSWIEASNKFSVILNHNVEQCFWNLMIGGIHVTTFGHVFSFMWEDCPVYLCKSTL